MYSTVQFSIEECVGCLGTAAYSFEPLKMQFVTTVGHPSLSCPSSTICLDILKDQWSSALILKIALLSLQTHLSTPAPDGLPDADAAQQAFHESDRRDRRPAHEGYWYVGQTVWSITGLATIDYPQH